MHGGPSHVDTFDYKPELIRLDGQPLPIEKPRIQFAQTGNPAPQPMEVSAVRRMRCVGQRPVSACWTVC